MEPLKSGVEGLSLSEHEQSGQGSKSDDPLFLFLGGFCAESSEFGKIFQSETFVERILYCIPNNLGEVDDDSLTKLYDLLMCELCKAHDEIIFAKVLKFLHLPRECLVESIKKIIEQNVFPIPEESKKNIFQAVKAMKIMFDWLKTKGKRVQILINHELWNMFWDCRTCLRSLPEEHSFVGTIRSARQAIVEIFEGTVRNFSGIDDGEARSTVMSVMTPLIYNYIANYDHVLLPLLCKVLKGNKEWIPDYMSLAEIIPWIEQREVHHHSFSSNMFELMNVLWTEYPANISRDSRLWKEIINCTFWISRNENLESAECATNLLIGMLTSIQELGSGSGLGSSYPLELVREVFCGFPKKQPDHIFDLYVQLASIAISLTRLNNHTPNNQKSGALRAKIVQALKSSCSFAPQDKMEEFATNVIACQDSDHLKSCLKKFFYEGSTTGDMPVG